MNKKLKWVVVGIVVSIIIGIMTMLFLFKKDKKLVYDCVSMSIDNNISTQVYTIKHINNMGIYEPSYQNDIEKLIYNYKNDKIYTAQNPLMILNPYGTNLTGLYIYFYTFTNTKIEYTISVEDTSIPDYTNTLNTSGYIHEGQIIGLVQGMENTITIKLINKNNKVNKQYEHKISVPDFATNSIKKIDSKISEKTSKITDGLYTFTSVDNSAELEDMALVFYDKYGILRAEFTQKSGKHTNRVLLIDNKLFYTLDHFDFVLVNSLGKIEKKYYSEFKTVHDYLYSDSNNSILYITGTDKIRILNLDTGSNEELLDLNNIMKEYRDASFEYYNSKGDTTEDFDWAHLNSIDLTNNNKDLILSLRETSSIIYVENIYENPTIKYIIAPERIYEGTGYEKYLLTKEGNFPIHAGQHSVYIEYSKELNEDSYYLYFFNNNYAKSETVVNEDWIYTIPGVGFRTTTADASYYYKYLVDEKKRTFKLVDSFEITYSNAKSIVYKYDGHYIAASGKKGILYEFDSDKNQLLELKINLYNDFYRGFKLNMKNFWFGDVSRYTETTEDKANSNSNTKDEENTTEFNYDKRTNSIIGVNRLNEKFKESNIIYYDTIYFTIYDYNDDTLIIPNEINGTTIKNISGINLANVKKIIIEEGVEKINSYTFLGCSNLEEIVLPSTLKHIGNNAFAGCNKLKSITIPDNVDYIGAFAFKGWGENQRIYINQIKSGFAKNWSNGINKKIIIEGNTKE